ncbi:MAG: hypothetical protein OEV74_03585 [Cyclobacteriaceae bacterium]|jgi:hypothetical protein|nr:hypothetical protein [Cyclobacteriaceae bacterium]MDH4295338.1 hypothetical protein [Cyclobacteriaceae bacterium]MDH5249911.1 hypothetical protein [Cyclobacteriaceae bacterium]
MKLKPLFPIILLLAGGCYEVAVFNGIPIRQYPSKVIAFSSQYSTGSWSANRVLGKENVYPDYGDISNAWASSAADATREFLVLGLDTPQTVKSIEVFETYNPGAIDTVYVRLVDTGEWKKVYAKPFEEGLPEQARIFAIYMLETSYLIDAIRIAINSPAVAGWNEIDAVAITGERKE